MTLLWLLFCLVGFGYAEGGCDPNGGDGTMTVPDDAFWHDGFMGNIHVVTDVALSGWSIDCTFSQPVTINTPVANAEVSSGNGGSVITLGSKPNWWNTQRAAGQAIYFNFFAGVANSPPTGCCCIQGQCGGTTATTEATSGSCETVQVDYVYPQPPADPTGFGGHFSVTTDTALNGWTLHVAFDKEVDNFVTQNAAVDGYVDDDTTVVLKSIPGHWNEVRQAGEAISMTFHTDAPDGTPTGEVCIQ